MRRTACLRFNSEAELNAAKARRNAFNSGSRGRIVAPERDVLASVLAFLKRHPKVAFAVRMSSGIAKYRDAKGADRVVRFGFRGCPDVWGMLRGCGRLIVVEVKGDGGRATPDQLAVLDAVNNGGGIGVLAYSIDDVANALAAA